MSLPNPLRRGWVKVPLRRVLATARRSPVKNRKKLLATEMERRAPLARSWFQPKSVVTLPLRSPLESRP